MVDEEARREAERALEEAEHVAVEEGEERGGPWGDAEEVRKLLAAVSEFLSSLGPMLEGILGSLLKAVEGERLGREVASFYRELREAGFPEDAAMEMTREYFQKRLAMLDLFRVLGEIIKKEVAED